MPCSAVLKLKNRTLTPAKRPIWPPPVRATRIDSSYANGEHSSIAITTYSLDALNAVYKVLEQGGRNPGKADGVNFQHLTQAEKVAGLLERKPANVGAAARFNRHQPFALQAVKSFAYGRLADAELGSKRVFSQLCAFAERALKDVSLDMEIGKLSQVWILRNLEHSEKRELKSRRILHKNTGLSIPRFLRFVTNVGRFLRS